VERSDEVFHLVALVIVLSILAHSSTDVLVARQFESRPPPTPREFAGNISLRWRRPGLPDGENRRLAPSLST
jgi:hypothetical protein